MSFSLILYLGRVSHNPFIFFPCQIGVYMAHFSAPIKFKVFEDYLRLSVRFNDVCVIEHKVLIEDFEKVVHCSSASWEGQGSVWAKRKSGSVLIKIISGSQTFVYSLDTRYFSELCNEFLFRED